MGSYQFTKRVVECFVHLGSINSDSVTKQMWPGVTVPHFVKV